MDENLTKLPKELPEPIDDGASDHLLSMILPNISLQSSIGELIDTSKIKTKFVILYFFPMMAISEKNLPIRWNDITGARGCTPQNVTISEHKDDLLKYNATIIGISTQPIDELVTLSSKRKFSQIILSDTNLEFQKKINIPTFQIEKKIMYKRLTLILKESKIVKVFYPIFPPDKHIFDILKWLENNSN